MQTISNAFSVNRIKGPNRLSPFTCDCEQRWALREATPPQREHHFMTAQIVSSERNLKGFLSIQLTFLLRILIFVIESSIGYAEKLVELHFAIKSHSLSKSERVRTC
jgi:hypothetical protein